MDHRKSAAWVKKLSAPTIELLQHGFSVPFVFTSRNYSFAIEADKLTSEASDRSRFLAAVSADKAAVAAERAADDAAFAAGHRPF
ncbi:hypothetical protein [Janthinobacterium sp. HLX7-2]|uniref:hypothetical protein n=1 Tax=Janthinobacterium sp. HLX7-2 TaxID=1259331 RepID=UPI003F1EFE9E